MRPDWLAEEERARDRAAANALFAGQGFTGVAPPAITRPDQLSQPDSSAYGTVSSSIGTSEAFLSEDSFLTSGQIESGNILDINFDMLNSGLEARNPVAKAGFSNEFWKKQQQFQQFLTKILRLASGAKECIV